MNIDMVYKLLDVRYMIVLTSIALFTVLPITAPLIFMYFILVKITESKKISLLVAGLMSSLFLVIFFFTINMSLEIVNRTAHGFDITSFIFLLMSISMILRARHLTPKYISFQFSDAVVVASALVVFLFLLTPASIHDNASRFIYFLSGGEDNASHFAMYNYGLHNESPPYLNGLGETGLIDNLVIYPQGIHQFYAYITSGILRHHEPGLLLSLRLYYMLNAFVVACLAASVGLLATTLFKLRRTSTTLVASITSIGTIVSTGIFLIAWGFLTQTIANVAIFLGIYALIEFGRTKETFYALMFASCAALVAQTWYLLLPVLAIPAILKYYKQLLGIVTKNIFTIFYILICIYTTLSPIMINIILNTLSDPFNAGGAVYVIGWVGWIVLLSPIIVILLKRSSLRKQESPLTTALIAWGGSILPALAVLAYQLSSSGKPSYYFHKLLYTPLLFAVAISGALLVYLYNTTTTVFSKKMRRISFVGVILVVSLVLSVFKPLYVTTYARNGLWRILETNSLEVLNKEDASSYERSIIVFKDSCDPIEDYLANRWVGAVQLSENKVRSDFETRTLTDQPKNIVDELEADYLRSIVSSGKQEVIIKGDCPPGI